MSDKKDRKCSYCRENGIQQNTPNDKRNCPNKPKTSVSSPQEKTSTSEESSPTKSPINEKKSPMAKQSSFGSTEVTSLRLPRAQWEAFITSLQNKVDETVLSTWDGWDDVKLALTTIPLNLPTADDESIGRWRWARRFGFIRFFHSWSHSRCVSILVLWWKWSFRWKWWNFS